MQISKAAEALSANRNTVESYVRLLEDLFLVERLPVWGKALRARTVTTPKVHVIDSGVAARLLRLTPAKLATLDATAQTEFGNLLETFVVGELRKHVSWLDEPVTVGHWRTQMATRWMSSWSSTTAGCWGSRSRRANGLPELTSSGSGSCGTLWACDLWPVLPSASVRGLTRARIACT